ncbi:MAG: peptidoglycan DD-metalloendopeptidase family protein [Synechococcus sp.]
MLPVVGLAAIGTMPGITDGRHNTGAQEFLLASAPPAIPQTPQRQWVRLVKDVQTSELAAELNLSLKSLKTLNDLTADVTLKKGRWVVLPKTDDRRLKLSAFLDTTRVKTTAPLVAPPAAHNVVKVTSGDSLSAIANRHGLSLAELRRLNPGVNLARLVIGSELRVANAAPRSLLAVRPSVSGGASWPALPQLPEGRQRPNQPQTFLWPAKGVFTSGYGWRWGRMHRGIDIANNVGTPIVAAKAGVVKYSGWSSGYGYLVELNHGDGTSTRYAHNSRLLVRQGQIVPQGQTISLMGSTGRSTGPHLHFEIRQAGGAAVDPMRLLPSRQA